MCLLPDRLLDRINAGKDGALTVRFSNSGDFLAVACCEGDVCPIRLYTLESPEGAVLMYEFDGHHSIVYDLCWSADDRFLVSASADGTAKLWNVGGSVPASVPAASLSATDAETQAAASAAGSAAEIGGASGAAASGRAQSGAFPRSAPWAVLHHSPPCFVYSAAFTAPPSSAAAKLAAQAQLNRGGTVPPPHVITGGFDGVLRFWDGATGVLLGVLDKEDEVGAERRASASAAAPRTRAPHQGHINAVVVDQRSGKVYTGDSMGGLAIWKRSASGAIPENYTYRRLHHDDLVDKPITSLALHPTRRRGQLLVQAHQNLLLLFDLSTNRPIKVYTGSMCRLSMIRARFSPDGRYVIAGSEDGRAYVWDALSGIRVQAALNSLSYPQPLCDVAWHPSQHVLALTCFGGESPVLVYYAERSAGVLLPGSASTGPRDPDGTMSADGGDGTAEDEARRARARQQRKLVLKEKMARRREQHGKPADEGGPPD